MSEHTQEEAGETYGYTQEQYDAWWQQGWDDAGQGTVKDPHRKWWNPCYRDGFEDRESHDLVQGAAR